MRPDMVAGPIDPKWSRSNSCATGTAAFCAASVLVGDASAAATAAARSYGRFVMGIPPLERKDFAGAANLALRPAGGEFPVCRVAG